MIRLLQSKSHKFYNASSLSKDKNKQTKNHSQFHLLWETISINRPHIRFRASLICVHKFTLTLANKQKVLISPLTHHQLWGLKGGRTHAIHEPAGCLTIVCINTLSQDSFDTECGAEYNQPACTSSTQQLPRNSLAQAREGAFYCTQMAGEQLLCR